MKSINWTIFCPILRQIGHSFVFCVRICICCLYQERHPFELHNDCVQGVEEGKGCSILSKKLQSLCSCKNNFTSLVICGIFRIIFGCHGKKSIFRSSHSTGNLSLCLFTLMLATSCCQINGGNFSCETFAFVSVAHDRDAVQFNGFIFSVGQLFLICSVLVAGWLGQSKPSHDSH